MFDRIAGFYDVMNSVMTAGCTTAGASARPTSRGCGRAAGARRRHRHRRPRVELARRVRRAAR
jgi:hypothetical protein